MPSSALLVVPQFAVATFTLVFLVGERHWDACIAGRLIFWFQLAGAAGRIGSGVWSDAVGCGLDRCVNWRWPARADDRTGRRGATGGVWIIVVFGLAAVVTVADNGLAYTSVAELAGTAWSGRALGVQNTGQNIAPSSPLRFWPRDRGIALCIGILQRRDLPAAGDPAGAVRAERQRRLEVTRAAPTASPSAR